jgi:hypothetical protein
MMYQNLSKTLKKEMTIALIFFLFLRDWYSTDSVFDKSLGTSGSNHHMTRMGYDNNCNGMTSSNTLIYGSDIGMTTKSSHWRVSGCHLNRCPEGIMKVINT